MPLEELLRSLPPQLLGGPSSPSRTPSSRDSDTRDGPEEGGEEEPSQVLQVWGEWVEGGLRVGAEVEFWGIRSVVVFRSSPWYRAVGSHLGMDKEESGFGASCILSWAVFGAVVEERTVLYSLTAMWP